MLYCYIVELKLRSNAIVILAKIDESNLSIGDYQGVLTKTYHKLVSIHKVDQASINVRSK